MHLHRGSNKRSFHNSASPDPALVQVLLDIADDQRPTRWLEIANRRVWLSMLFVNALLIEWRAQDQDSDTHSSTRTSRKRSSLTLHIDAPDCIICWWILGLNSLSPSSIRLARLLSIKLGATRECWCCQWSQAATCLWLSKNNYLIHSLKETSSSSYCGSIAFAHC